MIPGSRFQHGSMNLAKQDVYDGFTAGMILNISPERLPNSALQNANNAEFDPARGVLRKADGVEQYFDAGVAVQSGFDWNGKKIFNSGQSLYYTDGNSKTLIGTLTGTNKPVYSTWSDELLIASGAKLQHLDAAWTLTTYSASMTCDNVWMREDGRANASLSGDDFVYESAIGDPSSWDTTPQAGKDWTSATAADPKYYEVGYQDGLNIIRVDKFADGLLVSKEADGRFAQYVVRGLYPDWTITTIPSCPVFDTVTGNNDVYAIGQAGFKSFKTVIQYGDFQQDETGIAVNSAMIQDGIDSGSKVWHLPSRKQVWVKLTNDKAVWMYHYAIQDPVTNRTGAWTRREFVYDLNDAWEYQGVTYIAYGNKIGKLSASVSTDDGTEFVMEVESGRKTSFRNLNLAYVKLDLESKDAGTGVIQVGSWSEVLTFVASSDEAYTDTDEAFTDTDPAVGNEFMSKEFWVNESMTDYTVKITCESGSIGIRNISMIFAEV